MPSYFITEMNQLCRPNAIVLTVTKNMTIPNGIFLTTKKKFAYFTFEYQ